MYWVSIQPDNVAGPPPRVSEIQSKLKVTMYYADWCPHCHHFKPKFEQWAVEEEVDVEMIDCAKEEHKDRFEDAKNNKGLIGFPYVIFNMNNQDFVYPSATSGFESKGLREYKEKLFLEQKVYG